MLVAGLDRGPRVRWWLAIQVLRMMPWFFEPGVFQASSRLPWRTPLPELEGSQPAHSGIVGKRTRRCAARRAMTPRNALYGALLLLWGCSRLNQTTNETLQLERLTSGLQVSFPCSRTLERTKPNIARLRPDAYRRHPLEVHIPRRLYSPGSRPLVDMVLQR